MEAGYSIVDFRGRIRLFLRKSVCKSFGVRTVRRPDFGPVRMSRIPGLPDHAARRVFSCVPTENINLKWSKNKT